MTTALYIRVSTEEQAREGYSISAQRKQLIEYCQQRGIDDYKIYPEEGKSAKNLKRPEMEKMLQHIKDGRITSVLVYRLDRLTRSMKDLQFLLETFEENNCTVQSITEDFQTKSAMGRLYINIVASIAAWERENLGERVSMGQDEKARQGKFMGPAPYGFRKNDDQLEHDEEKVKVLKEIVDLALSGRSARQIADLLNARNEPPIRGYMWHIATILALLRNPALYGAMKWKNEVIENTHEGIISKEDFLVLRQVVEGRSNFKQRDTKSIFIFQGKLICPTCGNILTCERGKYVKKDKTVSEYNHYRCQPCVLNKRKAIAVSEIKLMKALLLYTKDYKVEVDPVENENEKKIEAFNREIANVERQRAKYQQAWSLDFITDEEFQNRMNETSERLKELNRAIISVDPVVKKVDPQKVKAIIKDFNENFSTIKPAKKAEFMQRFVKRIEFTKNGSVPVVQRMLFF